MILESVVKKTSKSGKDFYVCVVDGQEASTWAGEVSQYKGQALPEGWRLEDGEYGKKLIPPKREGGFQKKEWKQPDPASMYKCNAMTNAVQFNLGKSIEAVLTSYNMFYKAMMEPESQPKLDNPAPSSTNAKTPATPSQINAINNMAKARKMSTDDFLIESIGYGVPLPEISKSEASMAIGYWNKKDQEGEPF